jgi:hypothetical protein
MPMLAKRCNSAPRMADAQAWVFGTGYRLSLMNLIPGGALVSSLCSRASRLAMPLMHSSIAAASVARFGLLLAL